MSLPENSVELMWSKPTPGPASKMHLAVGPVTGNKYSVSSRFVLLGVDHQDAATWIDTGIAREIRAIDRSQKRAVIARGN